MADVPSEVEHEVFDLLTLTTLTRDEMLALLERVKDRVNAIPRRKVIGA